MEQYEMNCKDCGKKFRVEVTSMGVPGGKEREEILCPYCGYNNGYRMTSGFVNTFEIQGE